MRAEYNSLILTYESNQRDIMNIMMEIALEEVNQPDEINASKAVQDTVKSSETSAIQKTNLVSKTIEKVRKFIKKIGEMWEGFRRKLSNRLRLMAETDKGFYKLYYKQKSMIKPHENVKVISYQYINSALEQPFTKILQEILHCFDKLRLLEGTTNTNARISEILEASSGKTISVLVAPYVKEGAEGEIDSIPAFIKYLVTRYRGEKKEFLYRDTQLQQIEASALSTKELAGRCNGYMKSAQDAYMKIKSLEHKISRTSSDEKELNLIASNAAKATSLYNAYATLVHSYYELKLEQSLNYRIILRKFYQF